MLRLLSFVTRLFMFWLPLAVALLMVVAAIQQRNVGMGILAIVVALVAGLYRVIIAGTGKK